MRRGFLVKRIMDVIISFVSIIVLAPVFIVIALLIKLESGGPVLFIQKRTGLNGTIFDILKFKTMVRKDGGFDTGDDTAEEELMTTRVGGVLRDWSLDELPQLINILKGDMSLVGPRPLLPEYLELYTPEQARRHEVKPGLTGWAQVNGRNAITWEKKFELDVWYVDNWSMLLDLKIFWMTIIKVFVREGVWASEDVTMEKFRGSKKENGADDQ